MTQTITDDFELDITLIETNDPATGWADPSDSGCIPTSNLGCGE